MRALPVALLADAHLSALALGSKLALRAPLLTSAFAGAPWIGETGLNVA
jgi:hypothetical protein